MFKNLVTNLPFSPSLAGQFGPYIRRLRREVLVRRAGLIFIGLALAVQAMMMFAPAGARSIAPVVTLLLGSGVLAGAAFFYVRARQLGREIRLIRRDANAGVL